LANLKTAETAETANGAGLRCRASDQEKQVSQSGIGKAAEAVGSLREKQRKTAERTPEESCVLNQSCKINRKVKIVTLQDALKYQVYQFNDCEYSGEEGRNLLMCNRK
jgi:hypothetical protein